MSYFYLMKEKNLLDLHMVIPIIGRNIKFKNNNEELLNDELIRIIKVSIEVFLDIYDEELPLELEIKLFK